MVNSLSLSLMITRESGPTMELGSVELSEILKTSVLSITASSMIAIETECEVSPGLNINAIGVATKSLDAKEMNKERQHCGNYSIVDVLQLVLSSEPVVLWWVEHGTTTSTGKVQLAYVTIVDLAYNTPTLVYYPCQISTKLFNYVSP